ncbi:hypothetical protein RMATCC62417_15326 [Rhizopus microsporus]|nr:hypothetical protein RMATCC62417_15326 [Rhizopus microsporus]
MSVYQDFKISSHNSVIKGASAKNSNGHPWRDWQVSLVAVDNGKEVKGKASLILDHVEYILHPTFENPRRVKTKEPYLLQEQGWGEFDLRALLHFTNNLAAPKIIVFDLNFTQSNYSIIERVEFSNASPELVQLLSLKPDSFHGLPPSVAAPPWSGHRPNASASSSRHASSSVAKSSSANTRSDSPGKSSASSRVSSESQRRSSSSKSAPLQDKKPSDQKVPSKRITSPSELLRSSSGSGKAKKKQSAPRYSPIDGVKHKPSRADSPTNMLSDLIPSKTTSSSTKSSSPLRPVPDDIIRSSSGSGKAKRKQSSARYPTADPLRRKTHRPDSPGTDSYNDIIPRKPSASRSDSASRKASSSYDTVYRKSSSHSDSAPHKASGSSDTVSHKPPTSHSDSASHKASSSYDNVSRKSSAYSDSASHKPSTSHSDSASHKASSSYDTVSRKSSSSYSDSAPHKASSSYDTVPRKSSAPHSDSAPSKVSSSSDAASRKPSASAHDTISRTPSSNQDAIRRKPSASNSNIDTTYRKSSSSNDNTASPADVTRSSSTSGKVKRKPSTTRYPSTTPLQRKPSRPIDSDSSSDELGHIKKSASSSKSSRNPKASSSISKSSISTSKGHNEATLPLNETRQGSSNSSSIKHSRSSAADDQKIMPATNTSQTTLANEDVDVERIMDYFYNPESVGNIHLVHNNEVDELTRSAWDIPNIIISKLACRLSLLQGEHRNQMQEIIIANETDTMEFTVENGICFINVNI